MTIIMYDGLLNGVFSPDTTGARAIFEYRPSQTALCIHTHAETCAQARKCGSKRYLGRWAFMATGPIEQVRRNGYTHIKRRGKRFHYSFVYGTEALRCAKTFAREKRRQKVATSYGPRQEWDISYEVFGYKAKGVEAGRRRQYTIRDSECFIYR